MFTIDPKELAALKTELRSVTNRIKVAELSISQDKQLLSVTLLNLHKRKKELEQAISEFPEPPDFTPNPRGSTPTPAAALICA